MNQPRKIPVMALKGGVGKTTTCLDLARELKLEGFQVGLLDVDIHASALPRALHLVLPDGYEPQLGGTLQPLTVNGFKMFSVGLLFPEQVANMWDGPTKNEAVRQIATSSIDWGNDLDYIVVDTPPTSGDEVQSLLENLENIYGAVVVCQPNDLAILALSKTLDVLAETGTPVAGVVANMVGYKCPNCGFVSYPFDRSADDIIKVCREIGVPFLGSIPFGSEDQRRVNVQHIVAVLFRYTPVVLSKRKGGMARWLMGKILK